MDCNDCTCSNKNKLTDDITKAFTNNLLDTFDDISADIITDIVQDTLEEKNNIFKGCRVANDDFLDGLNRGIEFGTTTGIRIGMAYALGAIKFKDPNKDAS